MKTLRLSEVSNTPKLPWYLEYNSFDNIVFKKATKHFTKQNTLVFI